MRIVANASGGKIGFTVHAEDATERALLTYFTSNEVRDGCDLGILGHTYECDYSAVTSFNFGWRPKYEPPSAPKKGKKRARAQWTTNPPPKNYAPSPPPLSSQTRIKADDRLDDLRRAE